MGAIQQLFKYRRRDVRVDRGLETIEGLWQCPGDCDLQRIAVIDISPDGFGMTTDRALAVGTEVTAIFSQPFVLTVSSKVVWCERNGQTGAFRIGLSCDDDGNRRLDSIYRKIVRG